MIVRISAGVDLKWTCCFGFFFFPYFSLRTSPRCARVGGPAYVHTCVVSGSRGTAGVLASSRKTFFKPLCTRSGPGSALLFIFFLLPLSVEPPARSRSCRECRIGTGEPSYGEILVRFLCFNPWFENAGLADFATPRASCQQDGGHVWCLTGALRKNMANAIMRSWLQIRFLFHFFFIFF